MKNCVKGSIVHVVPIISSVGAYGGPLRVALNIVGELQQRGVPTQIIGGTLEAGRQDEIDGVRVRSLRGHLVVPGRMATVFSLATVYWIARRAREIGLLHVHGGRDFFTVLVMAVARIFGLSVVLQTHGMLVQKRNVTFQIYDLLVIRPLLIRGPKHHLALTESEACELRLLGAKTISLLPNGITPLEAERVDGGRKPDVLFLARLHRRKNPLLFVGVAQALKAYEARWSIVGPDEGDLGAVLRSIDGYGLQNVVYEGALPYEKTDERLRRADIYVLPSVDEPFPMTVIEALRVGTAVVCTSSCGLAPWLAEYDAALVAEPTLEAISDAVRALLEDPARRQALSLNGRRLVADKLNIERVVDTLRTIYAQQNAAAGRKI